MKTTKTQKQILDTLAQGKEECIEVGKGLPYVLKLRAARQLSALGLVRIVPHACNNIGSGNHIFFVRAL